jgi:hypothetical protein
VRVEAGVEADVGGAGSAVDDSEERELPAVDERRRSLRVEVRAADLDGQGRRSLAVALLVVVVAAPGDGGGKDEQQRTLNT